MDASTIQSLVGTLGFPIVCCGLLFWQQNKTMKDFSDQIQKSVDALSSAVNQNTNATTNLVATVETLLKVRDTING